LPLVAELLVGEVGFLELLAVEVVEVGVSLARKRVQEPRASMRFMKRSGSSSPCVHVVGAAAVVTRVAAELEELEDVVVPGLEVGAAGALRLPPWLTATSWSLWSLRKGMTPWTRRGAGDVRAGAADGGPGAAEAAGPLGEGRRCRRCALEDALDGVVDVVEVAGASAASGACRS